MCQVTAVLGWISDCFMLLMMRCWLVVYDLSFRDQLGNYKISSFETASNLSVNCYYVTVTAGFAVSGTGYFVNIASEVAGLLILT